MLEPTLKTVKEYIELLKNIRWLKENWNSLLYPQGSSISELDRLETQIIKKIFELIKTSP